MSEKYDLAVVGGGAAGMAAAVSAASQWSAGSGRLKIALLEANPRVGKKLLATGNGRCNLTNMRIAPERYHGDADRILPMLGDFSPQYIIEFFASLGLLCRELDEGRVYPYNLQAAAVLDVLRAQLERFHVETICGFPVGKVEKSAAGFLVSGPEHKIETRSLVFATGGMAYPQLGANESGYAVLKALGHSCTPLFPALVQLKTDSRRAKPLKGARCAAKAALLADGRPAGQSRGEVQFTEHGLSGICIFDLSRLAGEFRNAGLEVSLDLMPEFSARQVAEFLKRRQTALPFLPAADLLNGCLNRMVGQEIMKQVFPSLKKRMGDLNERELSSASNAVKGFRFPVSGTLSWRDAQVTAGGVPLREVDGAMQSRLCPGLYLAGEVLNIDGDCGGFNLHWAWSSGILAGRSAALALKNGKR
ncbi:MAG: aminoacetone oxidase family FAD-binding enzyme [Clostridiales bacterium]|nr:aminoacetone oxidase family FAD-binding enzyme [Clostridiales bacterium]